MFTLLSPGGSDIFESTEPPDTLLVGSTEGVLSLTRRQDRVGWELAGRSLSDCHIHALLFEPQSRLLFAGVHKGSVFVSADLGRNWEPRCEGLSEADVYCLASSTWDGKVTLFAGTEPAHLFASYDLGRTWNELSGLRSVPSVAQWTFHGPPHIGHVKHIAVDQAPGVLYASIEIGGLLRSNDGGRTWEELSGVPEDVHRVHVLRSNSEKVYVCTGNGIFLSHDRCKSFQALTTPESRVGCPDGLIIHPAKEYLLFISGASALPRTWRQTGSADARIGRSHDGGRTWNYPDKGLPGHIPGNIEALSLHNSDRSNYLFAGTTDGDIFFSDDEGESWSTLASGLPPISKGRHYSNLRKFRAAVQNPQAPAAG